MNATQPVGRRCLTPTGTTSFERTPPAQRSRAPAGRPRGDHRGRRLLCRWSGRPCGLLARQAWSGLRQPSGPELLQAVLAVIIVAAASWIIATSPDDIPKRGESLPALVGGDPVLIKVEAGDAAGKI